MTGTYSGSGGTAGGFGAFLAAAGAGLVLVPLFWSGVAARQVVSWRHATGERRQQSKWLTSGAVIALIGLALIAVGPPKDQVLGRATCDLAFLALAGLPVSMGIGILKYRLYEIDRIISRTLAYAIVTGLLVGVYAGLVLLTTQVFRSPHAGRGGCRHAGGGGVVQPAAAAGAAGGGPAVQPSPI